MSDSLNDRARVRLREQKAKLGFSQRDLAVFTQWSQAKVDQKLRGVSPITLNELDALCAAMNIRPTEVVRDRGLEFCAEMTPTELRIMEIVRRLPKPTFDALLQLLQVQPRNSEIEPRGATPRKKDRKSIRRAG